MNFLPYDGESIYSINLSNEKLTISDISLPKNHLNETVGTYTFEIKSRKKRNGRIYPVERLEILLEEDN